PVFQSQRTALETQPSSAWREYTHTHTHTPHTHTHTTLFCFSLFLHTQPHTIPVYLHIAVCLYAFVCVCVCVCVCMSRFPAAHFGKLYGLVMALSAVCVSSVQYECVCV